MYPRSPSGLRRLEAALLIPVEWAGRLAAACGLVMVFVVAGNVLTRYGFNLSSVALQELEWHLVSPIALIGMSYAMQKGEHVRVDFLYARLPARWQAAVDLVTDFLVIGVAVTVVVLSLPYVQQSYGILEGSPDPGGLPYRWVLKAFIPLGFGLLGLQAASQALGALTTFAAARAERAALQ